MTGILGELGEACEIAFATIGKLVLLIAIGPFLLHLSGLLLLLILGAPLWFVATLLLGLN